MLPSLSKLRLRLSFQFPVFCFDNAVLSIPQGATLPRYLRLTADGIL